MSTTPTSFTATALAQALRECLAATAVDRCLADVVQAVEEVHERAATLLAVAARLDEEMEVDLDAVVIAGWAGQVDADVPDVVPAAWLDAEGGQGGRA